MTTQHTPTPWLSKADIEHPNKTSVFASEGKKWIALCDGLNLATEESEANAAFIVRACNAHEGLVKALKASDSRRRMLEGGMKPFNGTSAAVAFVTELNSIVDAAISKAEGK